MAETGFDWVLDAEEGGSTPWGFDSITQFGTSTIAPDATNPNNDTNSYRLSPDGSNPSTAAYSWTNTDKAEYWVRFYLYLPNVNLDTSWTYATLFRLFDGATEIGNFGVLTNGTPIPYQWWAGPGSVQNVTTTNFSLGAWHLIEIRYVTSATVGGVELYVDGTSVISDLDQDTSGNYFDNFTVGTVSHATVWTNTGETVDFDDIVGAETQPGAYSSGGSIIPQASYYRMMQG